MTRLQPILPVVPRRRIVVADDDPAFRGSLADAVRAHGFEVTVAASGMELVERVVYQGPFVALLADISMPWMNGLQAVRRLHAFGLALPAVMISALEDRELEAWVRCLGAQTVLLRKPFELPLLWRTLDDLLAPAR
ncbi:MAG: response regulator [Archangiaceae bacterium]|nr:response regulator [Archangiaceae bacterium]